MQNAYIAVLGYVLWMFVLLSVLLVLRVKAGRAGMKASQFTSTSAELSSFAQRVSRAHANCCENLPIFLAIVFVASQTGKLAVFDGTVFIFLAARVLQSLAHLYSGRARIVMVRACFYWVQCAIQIYWIVILLVS